MSETKLTFSFLRFQTPAARFQEARRDVRSTNNNNNNPKARKVPSNGSDNKQKQHDNKRVNNQPNNGVSSFQQRKINSKYIIAIFLGEKISTNWC